MKKQAIRIAALMGDRSNPFWQGMEKEYDKLAPEYGMCITPHYAEPEKNPEAQARRFMALLQDDYQGVIINPVSNSNLVDGIHQAQQMRLPIFDVGAKTNQTLAISGPDSCYYPVRTVDFHEQGRLGAACLLDHLKSKGRGTIVVIPGRRHSAQSIGRSAGAIAVVDKHPCFTAVQSDPADFDRIKAGRIAEAFLKTDGDIAGFFCANDEMAFGVVDAVRKTGPSVSPAIVGVDGVPEAVDAVFRGDILATVHFSAEEVGHVVLDKVRSVFMNTSIKGEPAVESRVITMK